jgi:hypothetical protein
MSANSSQVENTLDVKKSAFHNTVSLVSLNDALQQALKKYSTADKNIIIRCENLPKYEGRIEQMSEVFELLLSAVFNQQFNGAKLFLYVDCKEKKEAISTTRQHWKTYEILLHTNINTDDEWRARIAPVIKQCEKLLAKLKATVTMNSLTQKGCMFVICLQGKY